MDEHLPTATAHAPLAVNSPQGLARQFRVQFISPAEATWQFFATFAHEDKAQACLQSLLCRGYEARIIRYNLPAAA